MKKTLPLVLCTAMSVVLPVLSQSRMDSVQHVDEVVVRSKLVFREVIPSQTLRGPELERLNSESIADAMRYFSGVQMKDYGGVGGVKTVDVRSMGTNHLAVSYDGITLGNAQNGQTDLGQFSLDNIEELTLYNGQKSAIFQPASDFASASSVYIRTRTPRFQVGHDDNLRMRLHYGGSDLLRTSVLWEHRFSENVSMGLNGEFMTASGKYRFRYRRINLDGTTAWDTTAVRQNGDIHAERMEANLHGLLTQGAWQLKGYAYHSQRGIPGAIVNNVWRRGERQGDLNTFFQGHLQKSLGDRFSTQWMAKYAFYRTHYVNRDSTVLPVDNTYRQQELYLSTANVAELLPFWSVSASYDLRWNGMKANTYQFSHPKRMTHCVSFATAIDLRWLKAQASTAGTILRDFRSGSGEARDEQTVSLSRLSPSIFIAFYPLTTHSTSLSTRRDWLSLRAFAKRSFRMPTFNDLYYTEMGSASLLPETATQFDIGLVVDRVPERSLVVHYDVHADIYYNRVKDKIVAFPKGQQFRWTMLNLGLVDIRGLDVTVSASLRFSRSARLGRVFSGPVTGTLRAQYTHQRAIDVTDAADTYYRHQIPYIPRHSGSFIASLVWGALCVNYSFLYTGERYNAQENTAYNYMQPWYTSDLSACYDLPLGHRRRLRISGQVNNLLGQQYDVILNYPMPGRNFTLGLDFNVF